MKRICIIGLSGKPGHHRTGYALTPRLCGHRRLSKRSSECVPKG